ncbi:MAG TPA: hypothetical protein VHX62_19175 [Solirubrobacteraceae bacterium]|nr:hypothetical protein [Solirubrobacteraceae bacterium]
MRRGVLAGVTVAIVAVAVAIPLLGANRGAAAPRPTVHPAVRTQVSPPIARALHGGSHIVVPRRLVVPKTMGQTCFVGAVECSQNPCHELIGSQASTAVATPAVTVAPTPRLATPCVRSAAPPQRVTTRPSAPSVSSAASAVLPVLQAKLATRPAR